MDGTTEAEVESTSDPIHGEELTTRFFPNAKAVELDIVFDHQFHLCGGPLIHGNTQIIFHGDDGLCTAFIVPRPVDLCWHPN